MRSSRIARGGLLASALLSILAGVHAGGASATDGAALTVRPIDAGYAENLALNGTAMVTSDRGDNRVIRLTNGSYKEAGSAWSTQRVDLTESFETSFRAYLHHGKPGADGIAFLAQGAGPRALGGWGGGLGYRGIRDSVAVEFDTYQNTPDPSSNHLAVVLRGNPDHHSAMAESSIPLLGKPFQARVRYDAAAHNLKVYVRSLTAGAAEELLLDQTVDLAEGAGTESGWIGFTAATGEVTSRQDVYDWTIDAPLA
ncbi:L-type lectin-domain containing protein [Actinoplanes aureus]|uniref:Lectin n=1 Tax=Actinoplanes aureus TaxID=2792083 RepID=A0A931FZG4_9ACTN|nr:L-type lectin-domain containing protein [Actinoplanes aureus]MBG0560369.1 lectin [Actinoplanes aureus]